MAAKQKNIFTRNKPLMNIYSGIDHDGKEVEVREDAEQIVKWHEISDALVAAGYYRAQLQGLSPFDKIVGGLTWCIELCDIDVDISLLFEENLTIGKKIALTEKIVKILPSMKCPYIIEPHQIQGLDFINIYPLIQWLIKYSSEFREAKEDELRRFAVMQYDKNYIFESDRSRFVQKEKLLKNLAIVRNLYKPCRVRKRKGGLPANELEQVNATLSEYDQRMLMHVSSNKTDSKKDEGLDFLYDYEKALVDPSKITIEADRYAKGETGDYDADTKVHYAVLHSELTGEVSKELEQSEKLKYSEDVQKLMKAIDIMEKEVKTSKEEHESRMESAKKQYVDVVAQLKKITYNLMKSDEYSEKDVKQFYKSLKELARERNELMQIIEHREKENKKLEEELHVAQNIGPKIDDQPLTPGELKLFRERESRLNSFVAHIRLELVYINRDILWHMKAIDEVPGTAELLQYEKRFIELYNQGKIVISAYTQHTSYCSLCGRPEPRLS
ncbi:hypothetical protein O3G_MSEX002226 [Manduca sexta]|uniref:Coiled-coil domain-containing protein 93 n=1 Tax=Manduca sexta TaxID=7130 RepID=A0A921YMN9_MANSE|nr:hypothetical protein O3G_MSEX002226 [Manduca sexta]